NGGALFVGMRCYCAINNSVIWDNGGSFIVYPEPECNIVVRNSLTSSILAFMDRVDWQDSMADEPQFVSTVLPADAPTTAGDLHLLPSSPGIDRGSSGWLEEGDTDVTGGARILDGNSDGVATVDVGAFETRVNHPPGAPALIPQIVKENEPIGTVVGTL